MLYYKCPSCRTILANKQIIFDEQMKKICNNKKLSIKQKDLAKMQLLDDIGLSKKSNICCRMRIISYVKLIEIIV